MKSWIVIFICAAAAVSCSRYEERLQTRRTVISGEVFNMRQGEDGVGFNFCDPLMQRNRASVDLSKAGGKFQFEHEYAFAQNVTLHYANRFINLYIVPGDSIHISIDGKMLGSGDMDAVTFSGDNAEVSDQINKWVNYAYRFKTPEFPVSAPKAEYVRQLDEYFKAIQDSINSYSQSNPMTNFVKKWALTDYKFLVANSMDYIDNSAKWDVFTDPVFSVYNDDNFRSMMFEYHLGYCMGGFMRINENELLPFQRNKDMAGLINKLYQLLSTKVPRGKVRDMMLYQTIHRIIEEDITPGFYDSINGASMFSQVLFHEKLKEFDALTRQQQSGKIAVTGNVRDGVSFLNADNEIVELESVEIMPYLVDKYKGKVIYVDVWASWCGPCIEEMKNHAPALHSHFKDKDVVFVNLCTKSIPGEWKKRIEVNSFGGENYYLDDTAGTLFMGEYNISGFPTYLLINKEGSLVNPKAPRPSDFSEAVRQISALLE